VAILSFFQKKFRFDSFSFLFHALIDQLIEGVRFLAPAATTEHNRQDFCFPGQQQFLCFPFC
jgi:hypothetical protein